MPNTNSTPWEYLTYDLPSETQPDNREVWTKGLNELGADGWEVVGTLAFSSTVNHGVGPKVSVTQAVLLKRPSK